MSIDENSSIRKRVTKLNWTKDRQQVWLAIRRRLNNRRFWRDSGLLMLANAFVIGAGVIKTPATTWLLTKEEVGMIGVVTAWGAFLTLLTWPSSLSAATYHYVAKGFPSAFLVYLKQQTWASLLSVSGFWVSAFYWWYWQGNPVLASLFVVGGLLYPFTDMLSACAGMLGAQENFVGLFWYQIGRTLSRFTGFIFLIASIWWFNPATTFYAVNQAVTGAFQLALTLWLVWQLRLAQVPPMLQEDKQEMLRYGKHQTGITVISVIQLRIDQLLISTFMPLEIVADYAIALLFQNQLKQLWSIYVSVRYPPLVRLPVGQRKKRFLREGIVIWIGFILLGVVMSVLAWLLIPLLLPAHYASSLKYIPWVVAITVIGLPGGIVEMFFRTQQDEKRQYVMRIVSSTLSVLLPTTLMFRWGIYGVMLGRLIANFSFSLVGMWIIVRMNRANLFGELDAN